MTRKQTCNDEQLTLYYYKELTADENHSLEQHLAECVTCSASLDELRKSLAAVSHSELKFSSLNKQQFAAKVTARIDQRKRRFLPGWGTALAAATVLGLMVLMLRPVDQPIVSPPAAAALAELEVLEQFELLKDLDLLQDLELLQELG